MTEKFICWHSEWYLLFFLNHDMLYIRPHLNVKTIKELILIQKWFYESIFMINNTYNFHITSTQETSVLKELKKKTHQLARHQCLVAVWKYKVYMCKIQFGGTWHSGEAISPLFHLQSYLSPLRKCKERFWHSTKSHCRNASQWANANQSFIL